MLRGPNTGARFLLDADEVDGPGGTPTATSSSTTSPSRASTPASAARATASSCATSGRLNGTYVNRQRIDEAALHTGDEVQIGKFRLVFYAGSRHDRVSPEASSASRLAPGG